MLKWLKSIAVIALLLAAGLVGYVKVRADRTYDAPYPDIVASTDPALIARGKHLFYGPAHCAGCHAPRGDVGRLRAGDEVLPSGGEDFHLPLGIIYAPNITPDSETGIGSHSDGELARAFRYGVRRDGRPMMDFMPFYDLSDRDVGALISFLRSLPGVANPRPDHEMNLLGEALYAFGMIRPMGDGVVPAAPAEAPTAEYGRYISESVANCRGCHTRRSLKSGKFIGPDYAGQMAMGVERDDYMLDDSRHIVTPNLTPDPATGVMADWTLDQFIARFRAGRAIRGSIMPWGQFGRMSDLELTAIYRFLKSLDPVKAELPIPVGVQEGAWNE